MTTHQSSLTQRIIHPWLDRLGDLVWFFAFTLILQEIASVAFVYIKASNAEVMNWSFVVSNSLKALLKAVPYSLLFWLLPSLVSNQIVRTSVVWILGIFATFVLGIEIYLLTTYKMPYSTEALTIAFGTNPAEVSEYLASAISLSAILQMIGLMGGSLVLAYLLRRLIPIFRERIIVGLFTLTLLFSVGLTSYSAPRTLAKIKSNGGAYDQAISPYDRLIWNSYSIAQDAQYIREFLAQIDETPIEVIINEQAPNIDNVIFILGETLRRDYMSLYGYPLPTSPRLDSIYQSGQLLRFTDAISPTSHTAGSVPMYMTFDRNDTGVNDPWYHFPALSRTLAASGYFTAWISNQESQGAFINIINVIAHLSQHINYVNQRGVDSEQDAYSQNYDEDVLPHLLYSTSSETQGKRLFQVVHLMGSHPQYEKRYPKAWERFTFADVPLNIKEEYKRKVAHYINSVYYNDYVVSEIIKRYADKNSLIIYASDHGEAIYDDPRDPSKCDHAMTKGGVSVPLIVYLSDKAKTANPELAERLSTYLDRPIMLDLLTHSITDLLGISTKYSDPKLSFFSEEYDSTRKRIVIGHGQGILYEDMP